MTLNDQSPPDYYENGVASNLLQRFWHCRRRWEVLALIPPRKAGLKYLDIGCHGGWLTDLVIKKLRPRKAYGLDISQKVIAHCCRKLPGHHFQAGKATRLPYRKNFFDLITCLEVLEHLENPRKAILEMKRCLKKRGELIILIPTESWLFRLIWFFWTKFGPGKVWRQAHLNQITPGQLETMLKNNGFTIIKKKNFHLGMLRIIKVRRE